MLDIIEKEQMLVLEHDSICSLLIFLMSRNRTRYPRVYNTNTVQVFVSCYFSIKT